MDIRNSNSETLPVEPELRDHLLEPFITATTVALGEMAGAAVVVRGCCRTAHHEGATDISVAIDLTSTAEGTLVLHFPETTAVSLASRILPEAAEPHAGLLRDCLGEIANVIAGQAKALTAGTPYHFTIATPRPLTGQERTANCLAVVFDSDVGDFALELFLNPEEASTPQPMSDS